MASFLVWRGHLAHVVVFGLPIVGLIAALALQEIRARVSDPHKKMLGRELRRPGLCTRESPALRFAVLGLVAAAVIHGGVIGDHFHEDLFYGLFFLVVTAVQLCLALILSTMSTLRLLRYVAAMSGSIAALYLVSRTTGLPIGPEPWRAEPFGILDIAATCAELVTLAGCGVQLRRATSANRRHAHRVLPGFTV
jgi:hypothetical protein